MVAPGKLLPVPTAIPAPMMLNTYAGKHLTAGPLTMGEVNNKEKEFENQEENFSPMITGKYLCVKHCEKVILRNNNSNEKIFFL